MDIGAYIMRIHLLLYTALEQLFMYMVVHTGEDDGDTLLMGTLNEHSEIMHRGRIDERYLTHADNTHGVLFSGDV